MSGHRLQCDRYWMKWILIINDKNMDCCICDLIDIGFVDLIVKLLNYGDWKGFCETKG